MDEDGPEVIERDLRIYASTACRYCGAPIGARCTLDGRPRSMPHAERLADYRAAHPAPGRPLDARDQKVVAAVRCEVCEAPAGQRCVRYPGSAHEIPGTHPERREAWQAARGPVVEAESKWGPAPPDHISTRQEKRMGVKCACARCVKRRSFNAGNPQQT
jgi:hypothetical protein